ncbi:MAG: hypothetical protein AAB383_05710 [Patescibacteria group bacterium]
MDKAPINFKDLAKQAELSELEQDHFAEGMSQGAADLPLGRDAYTWLQAFVEREVLSQIDDTPTNHQDRPFVYATPKPLTPLYTPEHPRNRIAGMMFARLLGISVMDDATLRSTVSENMRAAREISVAALRAFCSDGDIFSTTLNPDDVQPPRMAMHFTQGESPLRVAFVAEQLPSDTAGRLVFGDEATAMYQQIQAMHSENVRAGRGAQHVYKTITGEEL